MNINGNPSAYILSFIDPSNGMDDDDDDEFEDEDFLEFVEETEENPSSTKPLIYQTKRRYCYDLDRLKASLSGNTSSHVHQTLTPSKATTECSICFDTEQMVTVPGCQHEFCASCLIAYIKVYLDEHPRSVMHEVVMTEKESDSVLNLLMSHVFGVCCPHKGCRFVLDGQFISTLCMQTGNTELFDYFEEQTFLSYMQSRIGKDFPSCPSCGGLCLPSTSSSTTTKPSRNNTSISNMKTPIGQVVVEYAPQLECAECGYHFCCACRTIHTGKCFFLGASKANIQHLGYLKYLTSKDCRICPSCHTPIEKNGGCDHMHCHKCQADFSWSTAVKASKKAQEFRKLITPQEWTRIQRILQSM